MHYRNGTLGMRLTMGIASTIAAGLCVDKCTMYAICLYCPPFTKGFWTRWTKKVTHRPVSSTAVKTNSKFTSIFRYNWSLLFSHWSWCCKVSAQLVIRLDATCCTYTLPFKHWARPGHSGDALDWTLAFNKSDGLGPRTTVSAVDE